MKGRKITWSDKISKSIKDIWDSLTEKEKSTRCKAALRNCGLRPNKPEKLLWRILRTNFPGEFRMNVKGQVTIGGRIPDFVNVNGRKLLVEVFGDHWHGEGHTGRTRQEEVRQRKHYFKKWGFNTIVVWDSELKNPTKVVERIRKEIHS